MLKRIIDGIRSFIQDPFGVQAQRDAEVNGHDLNSVDSLVSLLWRNLQKVPDDHDLALAYMSRHYEWKQL